VSLSSPALSNARLLGRLLLVAWHHRVRCLFVLGVQVLLLLLGVLGLGLSGVALDVVHRALRPLAPVPRWPWGIAPPSDWSTQHAVLAVAGAVCAMALLRTLLSFVYAVAVADLVQGRIVPTLRAQVYEKLQRLSFRFYDRNASGSLLNRVTSDVQYLRSFVDGVLIQAMVMGLALLVYGTYMFTVHAGLTAVCLATTPLLWLLTARFSRRVLPAHAASRAAMDQLVVSISEAMQGIQVIKGFAAESHFLGDIVEKNRAVRDGQQAIFRQVSWFTPSIDLLTQLNVASLLLYGGLLVCRDQLSVGQLIVFAGLLSQFSTHVSTMSTIMNTLQESLIGARRVFEVLDAPIDVLPPQRPRTLPHYAGHLQFDNVSFGYNQGRDALTGVQLEVKPGECVALFGAAGAGKSSLLSLVPRFYDVDKGRVLVDGIDVREHDLSVLRRHTAFVFQETFLFSKAQWPAVFGAADRARRLPSAARRGHAGRARAVLFPVELLF